MKNRQDNLCQAQISHKDFVKKVWTASVIFLFTAGMALLLLASFNILLLIFAGSIITLYFYSVSSLVRRKTKFPFPACLAVSIGGTLIILALLFWMIGATVHQQIIQIGEILPDGIAGLHESVERSELGGWLLEQIETGQTGDIMGELAGKIFSSTFGLFGDMLVIIIIGFFFTLSPFLYTHGLISLVPSGGRKKAGRVLKSVGSNLQLWITGQFIAMLAVFVLSAAGLGLIGAPAWLALALLAGILNFIPNFGPLITAVLGGLLGLTESLTIGILVIVLLAVVQILESAVITPAVQKRLVRIPPALIIIPQLIMGLLAGGWGIVLALPLTVVVMTLISELYVNEENQKKQSS